MRTRRSGTFRWDETRGDRKRPANVSRREWSALKLVNASVRQAIKEYERGETVTADSLMGQSA